MADFIYALPGPPFNFLGHFSETQRDAFKTWVNARTGKLPAIQLHHQIRAQQLRKTAGALEQFYSTVNDQSLTPSFRKESWQPGPSGHFNYPVSGDHLPMVTVGKIKSRFKEQLQRDDSGVFFMNHLRYIIERHEDEAQLNKDAGDSTITDNITQLLSNVDGFFAKVEYQQSLVKDQTDRYKGAPRFRVNQFDAPTQWELERMNHSTPDAPILIKEQD